MPQQDVVRDLKEVRWLAVPGESKWQGPEVQSVVSSRKRWTQKMEESTGRWVREVIVG